MNEKQNDQLLNELRIIRNLLSEVATLGKSPTEKMVVLYNAGLEPMEIANLINTTANTVRVTLAKQKSKSKKQKG